MSRNRMVSKDLWDSQSMARLPLEYNAVFIALMNYADDYGRIRYSRMLATLVFPGRDDVDEEWMDAALDALDAQDCIRFYQVDGRWYIHITNFFVYQSVNKPTRSKLPAPPYEYEVKVEGVKMPLKPLENRVSPLHQACGKLYEKDYGSDYGSDYVLKEKKGKEEELYPTCSSSFPVTYEPDGEPVENSWRTGTLSKLGDLIRKRGDRTLPNRDGPSPSLHYPADP